MTAARTVAPHLYARDGKRRTQFFTQIAGAYVPLGHDEAKARAQLAVLLEMPQAERTIAEMCAGYLAEQAEYIEAGDKGALAPLTLHNYGDDLTTICTVFGDMAPADFRPSHGAQWLDRRRKMGAPVSGNRELAALGSAFNYGMRRGLVERNPCRGVRRNTERPRQRKVEIAEFNAFLKHAKGKAGSAYMVALIGCCVALTGRRRAEILSLPLSARAHDGIRLKSSKIKAGETDRFYLVEWSPTLRLVFDEVAAIPRRVKSLFLFPTLDGQPYTDAGFKCLWNKLMHSFAPGGAASPEWFRAHDLRALYVSEMLDQGRDPNTHKNEQTMRTVYDRRTTVKVSPLA